MEDRTKGVSKLPNVTHREVTANGVRLHYVMAGEEMADPLVLLHGFPQSWFMWRLVLPALAASHFVVARDFPPVEPMRVLQSYSTRLREDQTSRVRCLSSVSLESKGPPRSHS